LNLISKLNSNIYALLLTVYVSLSLVRFLNPAHIIQSIILAFLGFLAFLKLINNKKIQIEVIFLFVLVATYLISCYVLKRYDRIIQNLTFIVMNSGVAYLLRIKKVSSSQIYIIFLCLIILFGYKILNYENPITTLGVTSGNGISIMLAVVVIIYYVARQFEHKRLPILPALINFLLCIWAGGRAGIIASFLCFLGICWINYKHLRLNLLLGLFFIFTAVILFHDELRTIFKNLYFFEFAVQRFSTHSFFHDPRINMITAYFKTVDHNSFLFGTDLKKAWPEGVFWNFDPHNSFINLMCKNGLIGFLNLILVLFSLNVLLKKNLLFFILFLSYILLALADSFLFYESWDFVYLFFIAYSISLINFRRIKFISLVLARLK
jgi:hypothetical protein